MPILRDHDQFYTRAETAAFCVQKVLALDIAQQENVFFLEPSAGAGAFLELLPPNARLGIDIAPRHPEVVLANFLGYTLPDLVAGRPVVIIGNPPFGRNANFARKFVNRAAEMADIVAFILPKTFQKAHTVRRLNPRLHLVAEYALPEYSFVFEGVSCDVPCVFQIWERRTTLRTDPESKRVHPDFSFVKPVDADFAVRRVGRLAGKVIRDFQSYARGNHYFLKAAVPEDVIAVLESVDWAPVKAQTVGVPSVGKEELVSLYSIRKKSFESTKP